MSNLLLESKFKLYLFNFEDTFSSIKTVALWLSIALALAYVITLFVLNGEKRAKFAKIAGLSLVALACAMGVTFLALELNENKDYLDMMLLIPLLVLVIAIGVNAVLYIFLSNKKFILVESAFTIGASFLATIVCMIIKGSQNADEKIKSLPLYLTMIALVIAVLVIAFVFGKKDKKGFDTRSITFGAISIAISYALSYLRIFRMPQGGSITVVAVLPLMIYSYMFGIKKGVLIGFIYGLLQALQDPWIVHPAQFLLDYPVAYSCIGLAGIFRYMKDLDRVPQLQLALGGLVAGCGRYIAHFLSGTFAFATTTNSADAAIYSLGYNVYVFIDIAIAIVVGAIIFSSKSFIKEVKKYNPTEENN